MIDDNFEIKFNVKKFRTALDNLKKLNIKLSANFEDTDNIVVKGLIGVNLLPLMNPIKQVNLFNGAGFEFFFRNLSLWKHRRIFIQKSNQF